MTGFKTAALILVICFLADSKTNSTECGKMEIDNHILQNPWMVNVCINDFMCAGVIIDARHILTAGNCVLYDSSNGTRIPYPRTRINVIAGVVASRERKRCPTYSRRLRVSGVFIKQLDDKSIGPIDNDLAIVRLARPLQFNRHRKPICLMNRVSESPPNYTTCRFMKRGVMADSPNFYTIPISPHEHCQDVIGSALYNKRTMFCSLDNQLNIYPVDAGSAFACLNNTGHWTLYGIGGALCHYYSYQGHTVYTNVSTFLSWIHGNIR